MTVDLKKRYDKTQTIEDQIQLNITPMNCVMNLESKLEREKEVKEKWYSTFFTSLIFGDRTLKLEDRNQDLQDQNSKLECKSIGLQENQRLKKLLHISQAQNSKLEHKNVGFQKSQKIVGDQMLKLEQKIQDLQNQNSELVHKHEENQTFLKCENQRLKKLLNTSQDQNLSLAKKNINLQDSLKIFGDPNAFDLFKCERQRNKNLLKISQDQNSKLEQEKISLQESLEIFGNQTLKLERRNQDLRDAKMCKICMDQEVSQVFNPCNHTICCNICITRLQKCPICRKNIESSQMIYF